MSGKSQQPPPPSGKNIPTENQIGMQKPSIFPVLESSKIFEWLFGSNASSNVMDDYVEYLDILDWKPNLILYGPPGTGKTFHAKNENVLFLQQKLENFLLELRYVRNFPFLKFW